MIQQIQKDEGQITEISGVIAQQADRYRAHDTLPISEVLELHALARRPYDEPIRVVERPADVQTAKIPQAYERRSSMSKVNEERHRQLMKAFDPDFDGYRRGSFQDNHPAYGHVQHYAEPAEKPQKVAAEEPKKKPVFEDLLRDCGWVPAEEKKRF